MATVEEPPDHDKDPPTDDEDPAVDDDLDVEDAGLDAATVALSFDPLAPAVAFLRVVADFFAAETGLFLRLPCRRSSTARCVRRAGLERA